MTTEIRPTQEMVQPELQKSETCIPEADRVIPKADPVKAEICNLSLYYGKFKALGNIQMAIPGNKITAIIGPSGCGKSTLLRTLNRMNDLVPSVHIEGKVLLDGENIYAPGMDVVSVRRRVGMVFQRPNPFPKSIYDNVAYGPRLYGIHRRSELDEIVEQSLQQAALWDEVKNKLNQSGMALSGGQQQRLCIARALAVQPEMILMDEPASALDPVATLKIEELMQSLKSNYTIVIVTHNMQQAARVSDYTAFMMIDNPQNRTGKLVEYNATATIFTNPKNQQTEDYVTGRFG
ncbi:MAG: phosphate ABC transporter ATP-binding protein PstB [Omnitrophica WOR_2 bacterium]